MKLARNVFLFALVGISSAAYFTGTPAGNGFAHGATNGAGRGTGSAGFNGGGVGGFANGVGGGGGGYSNGANGGGFGGGAPSVGFVGGANGAGFSGGTNGGGFIGAASDSGFNGGVNGDVDPIAALEEVIPGGGVPGQDYPILASVPDTGFTCESRLPGYYADTAQESQCQVFYICQDLDRQDSFLCPNGTMFNQKYFVCDWWFNVDCSSSEQFYELNAEIGKVPEGSGGNGFGRKPAGGNGFGSNGAQAGTFSNGNGRGSTASASNVFGGLGGNGDVGYTSQGIALNAAGSAATGNGFLPSGTNGNGFGSVGVGSGNGYQQPSGNGGFGGAGIGTQQLTAPSSLYGAPSNGVGIQNGNGRNGIKNGNGRNGIKNGNGNGRNGIKNGNGNGRNGIKNGNGNGNGRNGGRTKNGAKRTQAPSALYQTPG